MLDILFRYYFYIFFPLFCLFVDSVVVRNDDSAFSASNVDLFALQNGIECFTKFCIQNTNLNDLCKNAITLNANCSG